MDSEQLFQLEERLDQLCQYLKTSQVYQDYLVAKKAYYDDQNLQAQIQSFCRLRDEVLLIEQYDRTSPKYHEKKLQLIREKKQLDMQEKVYAFHVAETDLQTVFDWISREISASVSPAIKVDAGNPLLSNQHSCPKYRS